MEENIELVFETIRILKEDIMRNHESILEICMQFRHLWGRSARKSRGDDEKCERFTCASLDLELECYQLHQMGFETPKYLSQKYIEAEICLEPCCFERNKHRIPVDYEL